MSTVCYDALALHYAPAKLAHPETTFVQTARTLDAAFGSRVQMAEWRQHGGRDTQEFLLVCVDGAALLFMGPRYGHHALDDPNDMRVAILPYANVREVESGWFVYCPPHGEALVEFVNAALMGITPLVAPRPTAKTKKWSGPVPRDESSLCAIL